MTHSGTAAGDGSLSKAISACSLQAATVDTQRRSMSAEAPLDGADGHDDEACKDRRPVHEGLTKAAV